MRSFSVSGRVAKPGVYQAPAGISVRELIDEYCGGMAEGHKFYGYFPGGASGGILPASLGDVPLDFDTLQEHGCFIGSAAIIVLSEQDSAREAASDAMRFFARRVLRPVHALPHRHHQIRGVDGGKRHGIWTSWRIWLKSWKMPPSAASARPRPTPCARWCAISHMEITLGGESQ